MEKLSEIIFRVNLVFKNHLKHRLPEIEVRVIGVFFNSDGSSGRCCGGGRGVGEPVRGGGNGGGGGGRGGGVAVAVIRGVVTGLLWGRVEKRRQAWELTVTADVYNRDCLKDHLLLLAFAGRHCLLSSL